jgi:CRP-like cAMP-binding protein
MASPVRRATRSSRTQPRPKWGFPRNAPIENRLLAGLPQQDRIQLTAKCERIYLVAGESLYECGEQIQFVYFPTGSFASLLACTDGTSHVEVALIGAEGVLGMSSMLESTAAPLQALVLGSGSAWRMEIGEFRRQVRLRPALSGRLACYLYVQMLDLAQMVACTRFHLLESRLARWLLTMGDRAQSDRFDVTQMLMSLRLGVRRASVTMAATSLQKRGFIRYHRGKIVIRDRRGLERAACSCYVSTRESYERHLG